MPSEFRTDAEGRARISAISPVAFGIRTDGLLFGITISRHVDGSCVAVPPYPCKTVFYDAAKVGNVEYAHSMGSEGTELRKIDASVVLDALARVLVSGVDRLIDSTNFDVS